MQAHKSIFIINFLGDFMLSSSVVYFNASSSVGETRCVQFLPINDLIVEADEVFTFQAVARNSLDVFTNNESTFSVIIYDEDGKN